MYRPHYGFSLPMVLAHFQVLFIPGIDIHLGVLGETVTSGHTYKSNLVKAF